MDSLLLLLALIACPLLMGGLAFAGAGWPKVAAARTRGHDRRPPTSSSLRAFL